MQMICPQCQGSFDNKVQCPKCSVTLLYATAVRPAGSAVGGKAPGSKWHQDPTGRFVAGLFLSLGLTYGLLQLLSAASRSFLQGSMVDGAFAPAVGLGLFYGVQVLAVLAGGLLAGVGRRQGAPAGALLGLITGAAVLGVLLVNALPALMQPFFSNLLTTGKPAQPVLLFGQVPAHLVTVYGLPLALLVAGAAGGLFGSLAWKPPPVLPAPDPKTLVAERTSGAATTMLATHVNLPAARPRVDNTGFGGRFNWTRIGAGILVAIAGGSFATKPVRDFIIAFSEGALTIESHLQDNVTLMEIFALSLLFGGAVAGATTPNGLKQGLAVGLGAGLGMVPFLVKGTQASSSGYLIFVVFSALFLAPLGGWFGSSLLPPPPPPRLRDPYA